MSIYPKPKPSNGVFNPSNYTYIKDSIVDVDLTGYIQKSGDVMSGTLVLPSLNLYGDGQLLFNDNSIQTTAMTDALKTDIETSKTKTTNLSYDGTNTSISGSVEVSKIIFPNLSEQTLAFTNNLKTTYDNYETEKQDLITSGNRISCSLIGDGLITNDELNKLNNISSNIQNQLDDLGHGLGSISKLYEFNKGEMIGYDSTNITNGNVSGIISIGSGVLYASSVNISYTSEYNVLAPYTPDVDDFFDSFGYIKKLGRFLIIHQYELGTLESINHFFTHIELHKNNVLHKKSRKSGQHWKANRGSIEYITGEISFYITVDELSTYTLSFDSDFNFDGASSDTTLKSTIEITQI